VAEAEYDLGILMREDPVELVNGNPMDRATWLARRTGLDAEAVWGWGVVERVSTGLLCPRINLQPVGRQMLLATDGIAHEAPAPQQPTGDSGHSRVADMQCWMKLCSTMISTDDRMNGDDSADP
jgi:hypothetical protein